MTAFFKRNEKTTIAELEEYYANQPKKRTGMAWIMAFLSLVITILIIVGLFFTGRWIYRALTNEDSSSVTTTSSNGENIDLPNFDSNEIGGDRGLSFEDSTSNNQSDVVNGDLSASNTTEPSAGAVTDEAASTSRPNADRIASNNQTNNSGGVTGSTSTPSSPSAGSTEIPNTGTSEAVFLIPFTAGIAGYAISRRRQINS